MVAGGITVLFQDHYFRHWEFSFRSFFLKKYGLKKESKQLVSGSYNETVFEKTGRPAEFDD